MVKAEGTPAKSDEDASLEESVRSDPPVPFSKWNGKVRARVRPLALLAACGGIGAAFLALPPPRGGRDVLGGILLAAGTLPILGGAAYAAREVRKFQRSGYPALVEAQDVLLERIRSGRAERKAGAYDAYLPPPSGSGGGGGTVARVPVGMVFFPGARVAHAAYAHIAAALSDRGILVVVISLEPLRFETDMDVNRRKARGAIRDVLAGRRDGLLAVDEWVLAGHSAGAMTALCLAIENGGERVVHPRISKLVLCGVGMNEIGKPGGTLRAASGGSFRALVLNGTQDGILKFVTRQQREDFANQLPPSEEDERDDGVGTTKYVSIEGGNHAKFGHYGPQRMDGAASISREEQQRIFVETTAEFLLKGND